MSDRVVSIRLRWDGPEPAPGEGDFLLSLGGSAYLILTCRQGPMRRALRCLKLTSAAEIPHDAQIYRFVWDSRRRRAA